MTNPRILDTLLPHNVKDVVGVYDQNFNQIFPTARPLKAVIREDSKVMEHPVENGTIISDHRIILPVEVELSMMLLSSDYQDVYRTIKQFYLNATLLVVQTKTAIYRNQLIASIPHEEDPDQYNVIPLAIKLKQVQFVTEVFNVSSNNPAYMSTTERGIQNGTTPPAAQTSAASQAFTNVPAVPQIGRLMPP